MTGSFSENFWLILSDSSFPNFADMYLSVGLPGDNRIRKNKKLTSKKSVNREVNNLVKSDFKNLEFKTLLIKSPLPAMGHYPIWSYIYVFYSLVISHNVRCPIKKCNWFIFVNDFLKLFY